jgi:hypothetical protein
MGYLTGRPFGASPDLYHNCEKRIKRPGGFGHRAFVRDFMLKWSRRSRPFREFHDRLGIQSARRPQLNE